MPGTVLFLGAGATKSVQGPTTDEILPAIFADEASAVTSGVPGQVSRLSQFLSDQFHVNSGTAKAHYPGLPLLMSLLDTALDRREAFYGQWDLNSMAELRDAIELGIFDVLEAALRRAPTNNHYGMLQQLFPHPKTPCVITTNYDLIADSAMMNVSLPPRTLEGGLPNYHCGIANIASIGPEQRFGTLLKLHGSLNWLFCKNCTRLELGATDSTRFLSIFQKIVGKDSKSSFTPDAAPCPVCGWKLLPLLIAPSHFKDYRNPHLSQVWYEAQHVLRQADRVIFIGYSLPDDDVEVVYLLKRSLAHIADPKRISVVEYCKENTTIPIGDHPVGRRYQALLGDVDWHADGLDEWLTRPWDF